MASFLEHLSIRIAPLVPGRTSSRRLFGIRIGALGEIVVFIAIALVIDALWGPRNRFVNVSPHPFWIVVLLIASYYGTREGLAAALASSAVLLLGNLPDQRIDEDLYAWLARSAFNPLCWCVAALVLGEIRDAMRRHLNAARHELDVANADARAAAASHAGMKQLKDHFEARVAAQTCTVNTMYRAWRAIERHDVGAVLLGSLELLRTVMSPRKCSLYLRNGERLEAIAAEGWLPADPFASTLDESSLLYLSIVAERRVLVVADPRDARILADQGDLAGPIVNARSGELVGMLKIESIGFLDLNPTSVLNFSIVCEWIGASIGNADQVEAERASSGSDANGAGMRSV